MDEFVIAVMTAVVVCAVGVEQGIILAIVVSILELIRRQYRPKDFLVTLDAQGEPAYQPAAPGAQSAPGLARVPVRRRAVLRQRQPVRRRHRGADHHAPDPVRWFVLDAGRSTTSTTPPGSASRGCSTSSTPASITFALARADESLLDTLGDVRAHAADRPGARLRLPRRGRGGVPGGPARGRPGVTRARRREPRTRHPDLAR